MKMMLLLLLLLLAGEKPLGHYDRIDHHQCEWRFHRSEGAVSREVVKAMQISTKEALL